MAPQPENQALSESSNSTPFLYHGSSMHPTFKPGDLLYTQPAARDLAPGDVVVFYDPHKEVNVVHRVIAAEGELFFTRGDNNTAADAGPISFNDILGRVAWQDADGELRPVQGGTQGLKRMRLRLSRKACLRFFVQLLRPLYRLLDRSGIVPRLWHPRIQQVRVKGEHGPIIKYLHRGKTAAVYKPITGRFVYKHPYGLILKNPRQNGLNED